MHFTDHNQLLSQTELYNSTLQITLQNKFCLLTLKKKTKTMLIYLVQKIGTFGFSANHWDTGGPCPYIRELIF